MADNWWESSSRNRFESGSSPSSSTMALSSSLASFGWPTEIVDIKARSCLGSVSSSSLTNSSINNLFQDSHHHHPNKLQLTHPTATASTTATGSLLGTDPNLQMMGLGLSSQGSLDWNQPLFRGDQKGEGSLRNMLQEDHLSSNTSFNQETGMTTSQHAHQWRSPKIYSASSEDSSVNDFKQINRGFQLDQPAQYNDNNSCTITCQGLPTSNFQMDSYGSPATILQGLFGSDNQQQQQSGFDNRSIMSYSNSYQSSYGMNELSPSNSWSKYPQELPVHNSPPKQQPNSHLQFSNNARFWNAAAADVNDVRSSFFPSLQIQLPSSTFDDKPKITSESVKKSSNETSTKRPRNETQSALPAFKVRKEKMGDRITALQQLVSPFGKTDTASVLSEAIEYIRFLHEQVSLLSTPYMKNGAAIIQQQQQLQQTSDKSPDGPKQDLRSQGLCLVPVSSTFPMTHETTVDFWTPTFGGTFR